MAVTYKDVERASVIVVVGSRRRAGSADPAPATAQGRPARARASGCCTRAGPACTTSRRTCCARRATRARLLAGGADRDARRGARCPARGGRARGRARRGADRARPTPREAAADAAGARFQYVTRRANDRGALLAGVHPSLLPGGREHARGRRRRARVGSADEPGARARHDGHPAGVRRPRGRRAVPDRRRPAARRARRRPRASRARQRAGEGRAVARARLARALRRRVPAGDRLPREGRARLDVGGPRPAAARDPRARRHQPRRLGDLREHGARVRRRPRASRRSTSCTRRWAGCWGRARASGGRGDAAGRRRGPSRPDGSRRAARSTGSRRSPTGNASRGDEGATAEVGRAATSSARRTTRAIADRGLADRDGLVLFTYPLLVDEGRLSEGADELKAALEDEAFVEVHPARCGAARPRRRRRGRRAYRRRRGGARRCG